MRADTPDSTPTSAAPTTTPLAVFETKGTWIFTLNINLMFNSVV